MTSMASACCGGWGYAAPVAYAEVTPVAYGGCGNCGAPTAAVVYSQPVAPAPIAVNTCCGPAWGGTSYWGNGGAVAAAALEHVLRLRLLERRLRQLRRCRLVRRWLGRRLDTRALQQLRCFAALCGQSGSGLYRSWSDAALRDLFAGHGLSACRQLSLRSGIWPRPGAGSAAVLLASLLSSALCLSCADVCASALLRRALSRLLASSGRLARLIARQRSIKDSTKARVMRAFVFSTIAFDQAVAREAM